MKFVDEPVVIVNCRDAIDAELPTTARRLLTAALDNGWFARATYAKADVGDERTLESILVRIRRWPLAAAGRWDNGKFALAYTWGATGSPRRVGARDLARFVKEAS